MNCILTAVSFIWVVSTVVGMVTPPATRDALSVVATKLAFGARPWLWVGEKKSITKEDLSTARDLAAYKEQSSWFT